MSEPLPDFKLIRPKTIEEALAALATNPSARLCAGGTDIIVNMRHGLVETDMLVDISGIEELKFMDIDQSGLRIGAAVTLRQLAENSAIATAYPAIIQASHAIAGPSHREVASVGGNLCLDTRCLYLNQSRWWRKSVDFCLKYKGDICHVAPKGNRCRAAFSGDLAPALMVLGAEIEIANRNGCRRIPLVDFYREDGADHLALEAGELVTGVHLPPTKTRSAYEKIRIRGSLDFPLAGVAMAVEKTDASSHRITIAITGTNSRPVMVDVPDLSDNNAEEYFTTLGKLVQKQVSPQRTTTIAPHYRRLSIAALASRLARELVGQ